VATNENLAVEVAQNFPYEDFISKVLQLNIVEKVEKLLVVDV
jgi:hypothetical protein